MNTQEFRDVYNQNEAFVRRSLYWLLKPEALDEVVQDVFVKVWKKREQFRNESLLRTWIYRITMNTAYDHLRKEKRIMGFVGSFQNLSEASLDEKLSNEQAIKLAIQKLSAKQKICFVMYYIQNLNLNEISQALKISEGTVKSRLHSSRQIVQAELEKLGVSYE